MLQLINNNDGRLKDAVAVWRRQRELAGEESVGSNVNIQDGAFDFIFWMSGATHDAAAQMREHKFKHSGAENSNNQLIIGHCVD